MSDRGERLGGLVAACRTHGLACFLDVVYNRLGPAGVQRFPDPQDPETFERSQVRWELRETEKGRALEAWYRELLRQRREHPALGAAGSWEGIEAAAD